MRRPLHVFALLLAVLPDFSQACLCHVLRNYQVIRA